MDVVLRAGAPLEAHAGAIGRATTVITDPARRQRRIDLDCWYPASASGGPESTYEILPGIGFTASAVADAPVAPGRHPLLVWSHGRVGTRSSYVMLSEGLAARGYVVVAPDHPGDRLTDWLSGTAVDDATNEAQRVDDIRLVLDAVLGGGCELEAVSAIDAERVGVAGHSYGGYTAFALAGARQTDGRVGAVAGLEPFTRTLPASVLGRVGVPSLLVAGNRDTSTPPHTDASPAYAALSGDNAWMVGVESAGHQACSDVGLYLELAPRVGGLPDLVGTFLSGFADQVTGQAGDPWRPTV
ncbi:MAG TPA: prolyl oligopeptidase family serine peptidase, partial [Acidimicrobiales bacterium]|nr:prolyl oligopeptidase family serine peptidase [Acidimicrobiales bacterium]